MKSQHHWFSKIYLINDLQQEKEREKDCVSNLLNDGKCLLRGASKYLDFIADSVFIGSLQIAMNVFYSLHFRVLLYGLSKSTKNRINWNSFVLPITTYLTDIFENQSIDILFLGLSVHIHTHTVHLIRVPNFIRLIQFMPHPHLTFKICNMNSKISYAIHSIHPLWICLDWSEFTNQITNSVKFNESKHSHNKMLEYQNTFAHYSFFTFG